MSLTTRTTTWREILTSLGTFGLGFALVAVLIHLGIRHPLYLHADIRSEKLSLLNEWNNKASSASFGSSHMHNGFDPRVFDEALAGTPTRTINLAVAGGSQSEQRTMALEFLHSMQPHTPDSSPMQACFLVLELGAGANFTNDHLVHPRAINIYDWPTTRFVMQLTSPEMSLSQRVGRSGYALAAMGLHYLNVGMLSSSIFRAPLDSRMMHDQTVEDRRGLYQITRPSLIVQDIQAEIAKSPRQPRIVQGTFLRGNRQLVDDLEDASPLHHLQVAYLLMPKISDLTEWTDFPDTIETARGPAPVINLARPDRYPQIYQANLWMDDAHLNEAGAKIATRLFAEDLQRWYAAHGGIPRCER